MDKLAPERRSENMRQIRGKNTAPELAIRKLCREIGFTGYRIHRKDLPGKPDLVWVGRKAAIFVHGCFWHGHDCAEGIRKPKSNRDYWIPKIERNQQRDAENIAALRAAGWNVLLFGNAKQMSKGVSQRGYNSSFQPIRPTNRSSGRAKKRRAAELKR